MSRAFLFISIILLVAAAVWLLFPRGGARSRGSMRNDIYVWQRTWTEAVEESINAHGTNFTELVALGAEVSWKGGQPQVARPAVDWLVLRRAAPRIGLALGIGGFPGPFKMHDAPGRFLEELASALVTEAAANGLSVSELQIDFDCAEAKLDGYAVWVGAIRRKIAPVPITITALPVWLKHSAFKRLIAEADGYVLQVHSLERPGRLDALFILCDIEEARRAVERAGRLGKSFRVALPTYGYVVAFDASGRFAGLSAEGPEMTW